MVSELTRRAAIVALWVGVYVQVLLGLPPATRGHTHRPTLSPWGVEARHIQRFGRRVVAIRVQVLTIAV